MWLLCNTFCLELMRSNNRRPYQGPRAQLVVSIDIGTTFTAASLCILQPGTPPAFEEILRWPKQANPDAKVPSLIYYDSSGKARCFGAETDNPDTKAEVEEEGWIKAEWWKLHLRPDYLPKIDGIEIEIPDLPPSRAVDDIFADFFEYVKAQLRAHLTSSHGNGEALWGSLNRTMDVVLTTPNGWEGRHQHRMRQATLAAGLVSRGTQVKFVTEAEAAIIYTAESGKINDWLVEDGHLVVCDCGGGTVDITGYRIQNVSPLRLEEMSYPRCYLAGGVFVNQAAKIYLMERLYGSEWDDEQIIENALQNFERNAKRSFNSTSSFMTVELGGSKGDLKRGIVRGRLKIQKADMISFFEPSIQAIIEGLEETLHAGGDVADKVIIGGGLSNSPYVFSELQKWAQKLGLSLSRPGGPIEKAVTSGALSWYLDSSVSSRIAKFHYGTNVAIPFNREIPEIACREAEKYQDVLGEWKVNDGWCNIVSKNTKIKTGKEYSAWFHRPFSDDDDLTVSMDLYAYRWSDPPRFIKDSGCKVLGEGFLHLCTVEVDLTSCYAAANYSKTQNKKGRSIKYLQYELCVLLDETEVRARLRWKPEDNGAGSRYMHGPAKIGYD